MKHHARPISIKILGLITYLIIFGLVKTASAMPCPPAVVTAVGGNSSGLTICQQTSSTLPLVTLISPSTGAALPFSFGQVFKKGAIPAGTTATLNIANAQVTPISTWDDGSVKHALIAGRADFIANTPKEFALLLGAPSTGTPLDVSNLISANPQASVSYGSYGTVSLTNLINSTTPTIDQSGPEYTAFQYIAQFPNDGSVRTVFYVQLWNSGKYRIRVAIENGTPLQTTTTKSGLANVSIANTNMFSGIVTTPDGARWDVVGSNTPEIIVKHDSTYLRDTKLFPNYGYKNADAPTLSALPSSYSPMLRLNWEQDMGSTGYTYGIGLLPHWDALYLTTGNERALASSIAHSRAFGSYSIFYRNLTTKGITKFSDFPTAYSQSEDMTGSGQNTNRWEVAHHPNAGYLAWIATGERFHLETIEANAFAAWVTDSGAGQTGVNKIYVSQTRARAWRYRTIAAVAAIAPDNDPFKTDARANIVANLNYWKTNNVSTNSPTTGLLATYDDQDSASGWQRSLFEHFFLVASVGWSWDQEMKLSSSDLLTLKQVRDFLYRIPIGVTGRGQIYGEYCYQRGPGPYRTTVGPDGSFYTTWGQVYNATYSDALDCASGSPILEGYADDPSPYAFPQSNWGHLMTALSFAVDHGALGALESYARVTGASNWTTNAAKFNNWPQYGVIKRNQ